jgi:hypothetical protein
LRADINSLTSSIYSLVLNGEITSVSMGSLSPKCRLVQTKSEFLSQSYRVESGVSSDSPRVLVGALGGAVAEISDANV